MLSSSSCRRALVGLTGAVAVATMIGLAAPSAMAAPAHPAGPHQLKPRTTTHTTTPQAVIAGAMTNHGGPVQTAPRVFVDFWGWTSDPSGEQAYLNRFLGSVGGTPWLATVNQYGSAAPANLLAGTWSDPARFCSNGVALSLVALLIGGLAVGWVGGPLRAADWQPVR